MLKAAIISFSINGAMIAKNIYEKFNSEWDICAATTNLRAAHILPQIDMPLADWVKKRFDDCALIIFVGACGIAVRQIAPYLVSKKTDPAVLVVDDSGKNVISLLSGHIGGANKYAIKVAEAIGANPVITTASDCNEKVAIDMFSLKNELVITNFKMAKDIESALLDGQPIGLMSSLEIVGDIPKEFKVISQCEETNAGKSSGFPEYGVLIGYNSDKLNFFDKTLVLVPKSIVVGVGCRRGKSKEDILHAVNVSLSNMKIRQEAVCAICSIDLKKDEKGLLEAAEQLKVTTAFYSAEELNAIKCECSNSEFVKSITGVDNVCERAAIAGSDGGKILMKKTVFDGVTVALALKERRISFE